MKPILCSVTILRRLRHALVAMPIALAAPPALSADDLVLPATQAPRWQLQATGYGWATNLNGEVGVRNLPPADVNLDFLDILKRLDGAFMGSFLAKNGEWLILTDVVWAKLSDDVLVKPPGTRRPVLAALLPGTHVDFDMRQLIASALVGYRLPTVSPNFELYATAGLRYQRLTAQLKATPGLIPITISRGRVEDWADPTVGLMAHLRLTDRWFVNAIADIGGFGVGSEFTAQGFARIGYKWTESISTALGYRAIYTDFRSNGSSTARPNTAYSQASLTTSRLPWQGRSEGLRRSDHDNRPSLSNATATCHSLLHKQLRKGRSSMRGSLVLLVLTALLLPAAAGGKRVERAS
jgi:hypothetical protein